MALMSLAFLCLHCLWISIENYYLPGKFVNAKRLLQHLRFAWTEILASRYLGLHMSQVLLNSVDEVYRFNALLAGASVRSHVSVSQMVLHVQIAFSLILARVLYVMLQILANFLAFVRSSSGSGIISVGGSIILLVLQFPQSRYRFCSQECSLVYL